MHSSHVNLSFHIHVGTGKRSEEKPEYIYTAHFIEHFCVWECVEVSSKHASKIQIHFH
jgi:predicted Zn-dependent peptidase